MDLKNQAYACLLIAVRLRRAYCTRRLCIPFGFNNALRLGVFAAENSIIISCLACLQKETLINDIELCVGNQNFRDFDTLCCLIVFQDGGNNARQRQCTAV